MPKVDLQAVPQTNATGYPDHLADVVQGRWYRRLSPALGLSDFGASHVVLKPGARDSFVPNDPETAKVCIAP